MNSLIDIVQHNKCGQACGIYSVCSAHPLVIEAAISQALDDDSLFLIEATSNQVDQFGGYTGMTPANFRNFVLEKAKIMGLAHEKLILGGDHLGPNRWQEETAEEAMKKADVLIAEYVKAGFKKIHLDCSMSCADDPRPLSDEVVAQRSAHLAKIAEETCLKEFGICDVAYIVGTEVPVPGGAAEDLEELEVTSSEAAKITIQCHKVAFENIGVASCWERVIGLVVQPGVEFDHTSVIDYNPNKAQNLSRAIDDFENMVFEAHSTDYQTPEAYHQLVRDHFAILKVGPALTFAMREAIYSLCAIEDEYIPSNDRSYLLDVIESTMKSKPIHWSKYYHGTESQQKFSRSYSFSDRIRYYWPDKNINNALNVLFSNLSNKVIPLPLLSQHLPEQFDAVRSHQLSLDPKDLILDKIKKVLVTYSRACQMNRKQQ